MGTAVTVYAVLMSRHPLRPADLAAVAVGSAGVLGVLAQSVRDDAPTVAAVNLHRVDHPDPAIAYGVTSAVMMKTG
jgi:hypothetical protein